MTLKLAETADGFASAGANDARLRITGPIADLRVQIMRSTHEAIMVGIGTALGDDPALTVRLAGLDRKPLRVVLDTHLRLPERSRLAATARDLPTLVIAGPTASDEAARRLEDLGVTIERASLEAEGHVDLRYALRALGSRGITRVFSEGGPLVAARLIALGLADEVALITADKPLGRVGVAALDAEARSALLDGSRYCQLSRRCTTGRTRCGSGSGWTDLRAQFTFRALRPWSARSVWIFLVAACFLPKPSILEVGFVWISLDSLVIIETFQ